MSIPKVYCVQRTNIQNLKAIHNIDKRDETIWTIVFKERIYKIWKQFTTRFSLISSFVPLCSKNEYTKSESNSQLVPWVVVGQFIVFKERIYKIWKQFTTVSVQTAVRYALCSKNEYTKSESNSQPSAGSGTRWRNCVQRTNIQNLKAIHNISKILLVLTLIVFKERIYKIWKQFTTRYNAETNRQLLCSKNEYTKSESNSQLLLECLLLKQNCVQRTNIQNLKAIHNLVGLSDEDVMIVFKERIYKIWKQFTTRKYIVPLKKRLCSKNEYTKSESNSQQFVCCILHLIIVFKERIYKIWKQFTTRLMRS